MVGSGFRQNVDVLEEYDMSALDYWRGNSLIPRSSVLGSLDSGWNDFERIFEEMNRMMVPLRARETLATPACDVDETESAYVFSVDIPGLKKEDINIETAGNQIVISGERKREEERKVGTSHRVERRYGNFRRIFTLPADIGPEEVEASYRNGVLTVVAKKPEAIKPKKIEVKGAAGKLTEKVFAKLGGKRGAAKSDEKPKVFGASN